MALLRRILRISGGLGYTPAAPQWLYRKSHVINPASGAGTGYQIRVTVHYGAGVDSGEHVYLNGKCRTDFGDIRFTGSDGETPLFYWMEKKVDGDHAVFWVKVEEDLSTTPVTIYIYYGNPDAMTTSNGDNTFELFDHFEGLDIDSSKWAKEITGSYSVSDSKVTFTDNTARSVWKVTGIKSLSNFAVNHAVRYFAKVHKTGIANMAGGGGVGDVAILYEGGASNCVYGSLRQVYGYRKVATIRCCNESACRRQAIADEVDWEVWRVFEVAWFTSKCTVKIDGVEKLSETGTTYIPVVSIPVVLALNRGANSGEASLSVDWIFIRKFVDPEPSHGAWGPEETWPF